MAAVAPYEPIDPPKRVDRVGGISKVAEVRPDERLGNVSGVRYTANPAVFPDSEALRPFTDTEPADKNTNADVVDVENGIGAPFTVYSWVERALLIQPQGEDDQARAVEILDRGWDRVIEAYVGAWAASGTALTTGGSPLGAIARVEQALDDGYPGRGIILASRYDTVLANNGGGLDNDDDTTGLLTTVNGTPIVSSGKLTPGTVFGIGGLVILHSTPLVREVPRYVTGPNANRLITVAEAVYTCAVDNLFRVKAATS